MRKAAICSRVTGSLGQNRSLAGGLQPRVMPARAMRRMSWWNGEFRGTSVKPGWLSLVRPSARVRKAAICSRVTRSLGQNRSLAGGLQPRVMPAAATQAMSRAKGELAGTSRNPCTRSHTRSAIGSPPRTWAYRRSPGQTVEPTSRWPTIVGRVVDPCRVVPSGSIPWYPNFHATSPSRPASNVDPAAPSVQASLSWQPRAATPIEPSL